MKILFVNNWFHPKNLHSIRSYKNIQLEEINNIEQMKNIDLSIYDAVYCPSNPLNVKLYPNVKKFIFGPHFSIFPDENQIRQIIGNKTTYIMPSMFCVDIWKTYPICRNLNMEAIPFGVDTGRFCEIKPIEQRNQVFIYYKSRKPEELNFVIQYLNRQKIKYVIFDYIRKYNEEQYLNYLQNAKFGIWLAAHESQGFALEEALSCNVPLFVWSVRSMNQEYGQNLPDYPATTIPYWNEYCGEYFYKETEFDASMQRFIQKLNANYYQPRKYVLENLSVDVCEKKFMDLVNK